MSLVPRMLLTSLLLAALVTAAGCDFFVEGPTQLPPPGIPQVYECRGDYEFMATVNGDTARLVLPDRTVTLLRRPAGDGIHFSRGEVSFWMWGDEASLEIAQESNRTCILNPKRHSLEKNGK